jgi:hypothetical protein
MKWLEVIKVRSAAMGPASLDELLMAVVQSAPSERAEIKIYRHAFLDTDLSVHLFWTSDRPEQNGSALGIRLAQALKDFGLVDHSVWIGKEK